MISKIIKYLLCFFVFALLFNPYYIFYENNIGDDASYVAHTYTFAYDADLNYCNEVAFDSSGCAGKYVRTVPPHPAGLGIINLPIVALFSIADKVNYHIVVTDRKQYIGSIGYLGMFLSVSLCFLIGLLLYKDAIKKVTNTIPKWFILLLLSSYGISFYVFQRFTMNHAQEFFTGALVFWLSVQLAITQKKRDIVFISIILPIVIGLAYLVRPINFIAIFFPLLIITAIAKPDFYTHRVKKTLFFTMIGVAISLILIASFNFKLYGFYFPNSTQMYGFEIDRIPKGFGNKISVLMKLMPNLHLILFSSEFGLWLTSPLLFSGLILLLFQTFKVQGYKKYLLLFVTLMVIAVPFATVLFWKTVASSYGYRYLFTLAPIAVLGIVLFYKEQSARIQLWFKRLLFPLLVLGMIGQFFFMAVPSLTSKQQINVFGKFDIYSVKGYHSSLVGAFFSVEAWKNLLAKRLPGFVFILATDEATIQKEIQGGDDKYLKVLSYKRQIKKAGSGYVLFILVYSLVFPYLVFRFFLQSKKNLHN